MEISAKTYISLYEQRIELVAQALTQHSKLSKKDASDLAVHVLYALDHIPEKVRQMRAGGKWWIIRRKPLDVPRVPESRNPLPWRNLPSDGVNHVVDANGHAVYDGTDAAEMFRLYDAEAQAEGAGQPAGRR